ncbi:MAG: MoaD/ThiS family protein [Acidobacteriaceae bacterium]
MSRIHVVLPQHLRTLAGASGDVMLEVDGVASVRSVLDALEARYPALQGTIRDHQTLERRAFLRFFVCTEDWSHEPVEKELPEAVTSGREPLLVIGAIAGGWD